MEGWFSAVPPASGTMNDTWLVTLESRHRVVLRRHRRTGREEVEYEHAVMAAARTGGVPCPEILLTAEGRDSVEEGGRWFSMYSWAPGIQLTRSELSTAHAESAGAMLARIQLALRDHPAGPWPSSAPFAADLAEGSVVGVRLAAMAAAVPDDLRWLAANLEDRRLWIAAHPHVPAVPADRLQVLHRDYQLTNLFFDGPSVSSVIDWDKARLGWPAWEVVRTLDYAVGLDGDLGRAFLTGYRGLLPLPSDELQAAAKLWEHVVARDVWVEEHFLTGADWARAQLDPGPFVPFLDRWNRAGLA